MVAIITRRGFLLVAMLAALISRAQQAVTPLFTPGLTARDRDVVRSMAQTILLHPHLKAEDYQPVADAISSLCDADPSLLNIVKEGISDLDEKGAVPFVDAPMSVKVKRLVALRSTEFFKLVYSVTFERLYGAPRLWTIFAAAEVG